MTNKRVSILCFAFLLLVASALALPAEDDARTAARATLERIQALRKERPGDGILEFYQAVVHLSLGERDDAFALLRSLKGRKLGLIPVRDSGFDAVWEDAEFQKIRDELAGEEPRTPVSPIAFRLKDPKLIPEGIAYDEKGRRFLIGSVAQHKIIVTDTKGDSRDFSLPSDKLDAVLGLTVDASRGHLYAVSTNGFEDSAKAQRRNVVVCYDLKTGRLLNRFSAPAAMQLNDLVVAPDTTLYVTDSMSSSVFRKKPDETTLTGFGTAGAFRGANGIALGADGALYVAVSTGIVRVDRATGTFTRLPQPDTAVTGGVDGLYWDHGDLVAIQNVTNPGRIIRMALADKGNRIAGLAVLQSHHQPDFDEPTTGAIANDKLYVIGNSYVGHYQPNGSITNAAALKGTAIIAVPLRRAEFER
ncbi:MAG: hypothetical protein ACJ8NS_08965 [Chthoniobacterales bacterium]